MTEQLFDLRERLNSITQEKADFMSKIFHQKNNIAVKLQCLQKLRDINERLDEIDKLFQKIPQKHPTHNSQF